MRREDFVRNLRGVDSGENLDQEMLCGIYDRIKATEFKPGTDHVTQVRGEKKHFLETLTVS